jgi:predicted nucleotidyltransferase component of viral defense system
MNKSIEQSVKQKLKDLSKETKVPFNSLLDSLFLERFLVRISASSHADQLIFKGGMCLAQIIDLGRETKDIDFLLTQMKGSLSSIQTIMDSIVNIDANDGFTFSEVAVSELSLVHKKYPGYRIAIQGHLGQIRNKVTIDIGVGDVVKPINLTVGILGKQSPIFELNVDLRAYPAEYIFSEKLEAICSAFVEIGENRLG